MVNVEFFNVTKNSTQNKACYHSKEPNRAIFSIQLFSNPAFKYSPTFCSTTRKLTKNRTFLPCRLRWASIIKVDKSLNPAQLIDCLHGPGCRFGRVVWKVPTARAIHGEYSEASVRLLWKVCSWRVWARAAWSCNHTTRHFKGRNDLHRSEHLFVHVSRWTAVTSWNGAFEQISK